jgi:hypothetical protein
VAGVKKILPPRSLDRLQRQRGAHVGDDLELPPGVLRCGQDLDQLRRGEPLGDGAERLLLLVPERRIDAADRQKLHRLDAARFHGSV